MSKFFKALEEAKRDRTLRSRTGVDPESPRLSVPIAPVPVSPVQMSPAPADEPRFPEPTVTEPANGVDEHLVSLVTPTTFEAEQYRALRHIVEQRRKGAGLTVLAVSSPGAGDGKTITSINLAGALAQAPEARVLLVDADLRKPSVGRLLGMEDESGPGFVGAILDPRMGLEQIALPRPPFNLSVVCAGGTPASPYDVLKSPRVGELLKEARNLYDYVVLDTPPLVPVQDCRVIDRWVDGFLIVVAALRTPRRLVAEALTVLDHEKILGFVFNAEDEPSTSSYHSRHYRGYYAPSQLRPSDRLTRVASTLGESLRRHSRRRSFENTISPRGER
jgi:capsular exopolysaccharide synthesis family protein